jgi:hypothetical protein
MSPRTLTVPHMLGTGTGAPEDGSVIYYGFIGTTNVGGTLLSAAPTLWVGACGPRRREDCGCQ